MCGNLHLDISSSDKLLINNVDIKLALSRNKPEWVLKGAEGSKIVYEAIEIFYRRCKIADNIRLSNTLLMEKGFINYLNNVS